MKVTVLMGSPRNQNTLTMAQSFAEGAREAGHEVEIINVGRMKISGCLACEYCHTKGEGKCVQNDDMQQLYPVLEQTEVIVFASPVYYFTMTAQMQAAIQRMYALDKLPRAKKAAMLLSSMSPDVYAGAIGEYQGICGYMGLEDCGVVTAKDPENGTPDVLAAAKSLGANL